jgi:hypothetical protein
MSARFSLILPAVRKKGRCHQPLLPPSGLKRVTLVQETRALAALPPPPPPPLLLQERPARQHWAGPRRKKSARDQHEQQRLRGRLSSASLQPAAPRLPPLSAPADLGLGPDHCGGAVGVSRQSLSLCRRRMSCLESARSLGPDERVAAVRGCSRRIPRIPRIPRILRILRMSLRRLQRSRRSEARKRLRKWAEASLGGRGVDTS